MGVKVVEYNIEKDEAAAQRHRELGGRGVPLIDVEGIVIPGYGEDEIKAAVEKRSREPKL